MGLVFVGGIHGAGKTTLCEELAPLIQARHVTASELIAGECQRMVPVGKEVADVQTNQDALLRAIELLRGKTPRLLLDGHFCVLGESRSPSPIAVAVFRQIDPQALLVLAADLRTVALRLRLRDGNDYSLDELSALQEAELCHARCVSSALGVPLEVLEGREPVTCALRFLSSVCVGGRSS